MSKQICFFVTATDVELLISYIESLDAHIIDFAGNPLEKNDKCTENTLCRKALIIKPDFSLVYQTLGENTQINHYESEAIEFTFGTPIPEMIIDTSSVDKEFTKDGFVVIDDSEKYHNMMKNLMEDPPYIENPHYIENGFEHGRFWYSPNFYSADGKMIKKSKNVDRLFDNLQKFIKTNFKLSKDGFAYIGLDAYEKYRLGNFIPCSGKHRITF